MPARRSAPRSIRDAVLFTGRFAAPRPVLRQVTPEYGRESTDPTQGIQPQPDELRTIADHGSLKCARAERRQPFLGPPSSVQVCAAGSDLRVRAVAAARRAAGDTAPHGGGFAGRPQSHRNDTPLIYWILQASYLTPDDDHNERSHRKNHRLITVGLCHAPQTGHLSTTTSLALARTSDEPTLWWTPHAQPGSCRPRRWRAVSGPASRSPRSVTLAESYPSPGCSSCSMMRSVHCSADSASVSSRSSGCSGDS